MKEFAINHEALQRMSIFRFYEELNEFLPVHQRKKAFEYAFTGTPSVKNSIEAIGIPHTEVDLILIDGVSVDFEALLKGGEQVSVYPVFESLDISPLVRLRPLPLRETRFVVDVNLGKLAYKLRLLGFDTLFRNNLEDDEIVQISVAEKRIILTRDKGVLKHTAATHGYWVRNSDPQKQLREVVERLQLQNSFRPFSRCSICNGSLTAVDSTEVKGKVPDDTFSMCNEFWKCTGCGQIYWEGTHYRKILKWIEGLK
ncbi:Mut7-C RNAse domain-containing protein [Draconibacterium mangrovi]|uniref:Mut7-C RNAse domain-containing protein n=1 Tax=Draconibacterium mangrovi TaxID=2697469 RepID=UPI001952EECF|nr:Mut7-C RNAse domain-containing protein [Draconibacterium mangrovi]